ncbi:hypothetical protein CALVIDRAFT_539554 [Calocera viscosa TUFC12733]|uniref:Uncharacterized protein n=1 Tax=Calocera viscosa (strain TUFC12733) TaxID=1330018 RepID=A0A167JU38_CALVF|nr:hypothetical protein CALVIDRAFT_539554 [Calocera viscosa TUFC12733]
MLPNTVLRWVPHASYAVTRDFGAIFSLLTWILFTIITAVLAVFSWAAYGYEIISISSSDFNATQSFWYDRFIPQALMSERETSCQPFTYRLGDSFRTSSRIFTWEIVNVNENEDEQGNWESGGLYTEIPYSNVELQYCDVADIMVTADILQQSVQLDTRIMCTLPIPILARTTVVASRLPPQDTYTQNPWAPWDIYNPAVDTLVGLARPPQSNISAAIDMLGLDLRDQLALFFNLTNGTSPVQLGLLFSFHGSNVNTWCPVAFIGMPGWCTWQDEFEPPLFADSEASAFILEGLSLLHADVLVFYQGPAFLDNTLRNLARGMHSAARADLGSFRANNIFQNTSALQQQINGTQYLPLGNTSDYVPVLSGASTLLNPDPGLNFSALPFNATGPSVIETTYLCNRQVLKSASALFFSITSGTWSNLFGMDSC